MLTPVILIREHELARRLAEPWSPVPRSHPRELLCYHGAGDVVEPLIRVHPLAVEERCLQHALLLLLENFGDCGGAKKRRDLIYNNNTQYKQHYFLMLPFFLAGFLFKAPFFGHLRVCFRTLTGGRQTMIFV